LGETALELAVRYGRDSVLELLLESGVDVTMPNSGGQSAFHTAAAAGQYKALRTIMPYTTLTATQMKDKQGRTPLHSCAEGDFWQVLDILVEYDRLRLSDIDVQDLQGRTALHAAAEANALRVARKLIELGADAASVDFSNVSVLGLAARQSNSEPLVNLLLANQMTQVDRADNNGVTPLMAACMSQVRPPHLQIGRAHV
jgi:ankyrin repeat protein